MVCWTTSVQWVSQHRRYMPGEADGPEGTVVADALSEHFIRNQSRAWLSYMTEGQRGCC